MSKINFFIKKYKISIYLILSLLLFFIVYANGDGDAHGEEISIDEYIKSTSLNYLLIASTVLLILVLFSIFYKEKSETLKWLLFLGIIIPTILVTVYLAGSTIYLNIISETKGPVHWHADYEVWICGEKVDLIDAKGLSNRVGTTVLHEHGDDRMHVEGVVVKKKDVDLHTFFDVVGGSLTNNHLAISTNDKIVEKDNGDLCNGNPGKLQVFLYKIKNPDDTKNWIFEQKKLDDFEDYVLSPYSQIPPGDCIIIEFGEEKQSTEHICETYKNAEQRGDLSGS